MNLTLIASLISAAVAGAAGFGLAWRLQTATINKMELDDANQRISLQRNARQAIERQQTAVGVAQAAAAQRRRDLDATRRAGESALDGLRNSTATALRAAGESIEACTAHATTAGELLNLCAARYTDVAAAADGHASDVQTLTESWPK